MQKLLGKKAPEPLPPSEEFLGIKHQAFISCSSADSFEVFLAYVFGAYLCKACGGIFEDPQIGCSYATVEQIEAGFAVIKEELNKEAQSGGLRVHRPE